MLYLRPLAADAAMLPIGRVPLAERTALALERALLATEREPRLAALNEALANDPELATWALRAAEHRLGRTINRLAEAADWLVSALEVNLYSSLELVDTGDSKREIDQRLPALARRLYEYEHKLGDFTRRLEHEKLESLKELAYGASHEINNPLANIAARAQMLLEDEQDTERARKLSAIHRQAMRAHEMISDLMLFARPPKLNRTSFDIVALVQNILGQQQELADERGIRLECDPGNTSMLVHADKTQLGVAVAALIRNSIEAVGENGYICAAILQSSDGRQHFAEISVRDDGPGVSDHIRQHMFDPFFSGREAGRGLGFGLSKCWRIVTDHGGQVVVHQAGPSGLKISIVLPISHEVGSP